MPYHMTHLSIFDMPSHYLRHVSISNHTLELMPPQLSLHFSTTWEPYIPLNTLAHHSCHDLIDILNLFATREYNQLIRKTMLHPTQSISLSEISFSIPFHNHSIPSYKSYSELLLRHLILGIARIH